jgi:tRNA nucleotidyltransferase (CCA-adding enzyme)
MELRRESVPGPIRALLDALRGAGHEAWLVGGCVRDLLRGAAVHEFDATTSAQPAQLLALFPRAVPIGLRHGTVMIPTGAGPFDLTTYRAGSTLADDLAHRDFTVNAIAWDPCLGARVDPHGGAADLARGILRAVGTATERFGEDPLRALRAARLVAALGLAPDDAIEPAMAAARPTLRGVARGIAMLRRTGIEAELLPGAAEDAGRVVAALPPDLVVRLAAWLRRTRAEATLTRLRFSKRIAVAVARLVALHPVDARPLRSDADVRRLWRRAGEDTVEALLALREAERGEPLAALRQQLAGVRRRDAAAGAHAALAVDGAAVMAALGCSPGPRVGEALRYLEERILEDPSCNTPAALLDLLRRWNERRSSGAAAPFARDR